MADPAIMAEGLGKRFGDVTAIDGVDLELPAGGVQCRRHLTRPGRGRPGWASRHPPAAPAST